MHRVQELAMELEAELEDKEMLQTGSPTGNPELDPAATKHDRIKLPVPIFLFCHVEEATAVICPPGGRKFRLDSH